jgi:ParB family chromosome partitioning protein
MPYGLGRGLSSLIPPKKIITAEIKKELRAGAELLDLLVQKIRPNPKQPREDFGYQELEDLINSIREHGILQPLIVSKIDNENYELIAGERRLRAAKMLNLKTVPAIVRAVRDQEKLELALIENIQRKDLNPIEEALAFQKLMSDFGLTQEEVAKRIGRSRPSVANTLRLLGLPEEIQKALRDGKISESHARTLIGLSDIKQQLKHFQQILKNNLTLREIEGVVKRVKGAKVKRGSWQNPNLAAKEETLRGALGTKVEIKKRGQSGQIIVHFYSDEELNGILRKIVKK